MTCHGRSQKGGHQHIEAEVPYEEPRRFALDSSLARRSSLKGHDSERNCEGAHPRTECCGPLARDPLRRPSGEARTRSAACPTPPPVDRPGAWGLRPPPCAGTHRASGLLGALPDGQLDDEVETEHKDDDAAKQDRQLCGIDPEHEIKIARRWLARAWTEGTPPPLDGAPAVFPGGIVIALIAANRPFRSRPRRTLEGPTVRLWLTTNGTRWWTTSLTA